MVGEAANWDLLAPREKDVGENGDRYQKLGPRGLEAEPRLVVEEEPEAHGADVNHGELVGELGVVLQGRVEEEAAEADEGDALERGFR